MINLVLVLIIFFFIYLILRKKGFKEGFKVNFKESVLKFNKPKNWNNLTFTEKLKIYGRQLNEDYSLYADKLLVKDYINNLNINELHVPKVIKKLDKNKDLDLKSLPKNCVIKSNCGSGDIIIIKNNKIKKMIARNQPKDNYNDWKKEALKTLNWKPELEPHYQFIKPQIFVEEYLGDNIKDYKFFCFNGRVHFCQIDYNRYSSKTKRCRNIYDKNFILLSFKKGVDNCKTIINKPNLYIKMIEISEKISQKFSFCRVDLYLIQHKIYFGEITFVSDAAGDSYKFKPEKYEKIIGKYWK